MSPAPGLYWKYQISLDLLGGACEGPVPSSRRLCLGFKLSRRVTQLGLRWTINVEGALRRQSRTGYVERGTGWRLTEKWRSEQRTNPTDESVRYIPHELAL